MGGSEQCIFVHAYISIFTPPISKISVDIPTFFMHRNEYYHYLIIEALAVGYQSTSKLVTIITYIAIKTVRI